MRALFCHPLRTAGAGLAATMLVIVALAPPAAAKPGPRPGVGSSAVPAAHCTVKLTRAAATPAATACFATFTEAVSVATDGAVTDAPAAPTVSDLDALKAKLAAGAASRRDGVRAAWIPLGIHYDLPNWDPAGWTLTVSGDGAPCTTTLSDVDYRYNMPQYVGGIYVWDGISSFRTFLPESLCFANHYYLQNFGEPSTGFTSSRATMPAMGPYSGDNNTRSITYS